MISSFYIGATGMKTHAQGMQVLGNNIANVNTVGFKGSLTTFANLISQDLSNTANAVGYSQVGMGSQVNDIKLDFSQGAFETTNTVTDLAISGKGFFGVTDGNGDMYYTRAGNFHIDNEGYMVSPHGYQLQGLSLYGETQGTSGSIRFEPDEDGQIKLDPKSTTLVTSYNNLGEGDYSTSATDPYFAMAQNWDGTSDPPLSSQLYAYSNSLTIYDENGDSHEVTIYFDEVSASNATGKSYWEFVVAMNPSEEGRAAFEGTSAAGMLMMGTLEFNSAGELLNMSAFTNNGSGGLNLENWVPSGFDEEGYPLVEATFSGDAGASFGLDLGLSNTESGWSNTVSNAGAVGANAASLPNFNGERGSRSTTNYAGSSSTLYSSQNGYGEGYLNNLTVGTDGVIEGHFSNGQSQELWQVNLYDFTNPYGLYAEGDNLYSATAASGEVRDGYAETNSFGQIAQSTLEQSNVDLASEFVTMITTQRGFQANSKVVTTSDSLLQNALQMKR